MVSVFLIVYNKMYYVFPLFLNPSQFYNPQPLYQPQLCLSQPQSTPNLSEIQQKKLAEIENNFHPNFIQMMKKELKKKVNLKPRKIWTPFEDDELLRRRKLGQSWEEISSRIQEGTELNCERRHKRLVKESRKWPKEVDECLKTLYRDENCEWKKIKSFISERFSKNYSIKSLRERYVNHLKGGVSQESWNLKEDLLLISLTEQHNREWQAISEEIPWRSERQIKNRFSCTLEQIIRKIRRKMGKMQIPVPDFSQAPEY